MNYSFDPIGRTIVHQSIDHKVIEGRSPISITWRCSCGWRHCETRRQNALARAAKLNKALREHLHPDD